MKARIDLAALAALFLVTPAAARPQTADTLPPIASLVEGTVSSDPDLLVCFLASKGRDGRPSELGEYLALKGLEVRTEKDQLRFEELDREYGGYGYEDLGRLYKKYGELYGINWKLAFLQMMLETQSLQYPGEVQRSQRNMVGLGADGFWERKSDGLRLKVEPQKGVWKAFREGVGAVYVFSVKRDGKLLPGTVAPGYPPDVYLVDRGSARRPMLRQPGETWRSGDRFDSVEQGVEAHIQHLGLYAGVRNGRPLIAAKTRRTRSHISNVAAAWLQQHGSPMTFGELGKRIQVYDDEVPSLIWAAEKLKEKGVPGVYERKYAEGLARLARELEDWFLGGGAESCGVLLGRPEPAPDVVAAGVEEVAEPEEKPAGGAVWKLTKTEAGFRPIPDRMRDRNNETWDWRSSPGELAMEWKHKTKPFRYTFRFAISGSPPQTLALDQPFSLTVTAYRDIEHWGVPSAGLDVHTHKGLSVRAEDGRSQMRVATNAKTPQGTKCRFDFKAPSTASSDELRLEMYANAGSLSNVRWVYERIDD